MLNTILGTKSHMEQAFTEAGVRVPVTVVKTASNIVTKFRTKEKDGYQAIQLGFGNRKIKRFNKPLLGSLKAVVKEQDKTAPSFFREVPGSEEENLNIGDVINASDVFKPGDIAQVTGTSKGKGFAGGVKRWGFAGGPKTHGQSDRLRAPGSIGQGTTPGRVLKGKKMAGHLGSERVTIKNLVVLKIEGNEVWLSGPVPGARGSFLIVKKIGEYKKFEPLIGSNNESSQKEENGNQKSSG